MKEENFGFPPKQERKALSEKEIQEITDKGVKMAQEIARSQSFVVGQWVSYPEGDREERVYAVKEVLEGTNELVVWFPDQEETIRRFPIDGSYDPRIASNETHKILAQVRYGGDSRFVN